MVSAVEVSCPFCGETQCVPAELTVVCPMCGTRLRATASAVKPREPEYQGALHDVVVPLLVSVAYLFFAYMIAFLAVRAF